MKKEHYPPWYGLPRGVELDTADRPVRPESDWGKVLWRLQLSGTIIGTVSGLLMVGLFLLMTLPFNATEKYRYAVYRTDELAAYVEGSFYPFSPIVGLALLVLGVHLLLKTRFLTELDEQTDGTRLLVFLYAAPGALAAIVALAAIGAALILMLLFGLLLLIALVFAASMRE